MSVASIQEKIVEYYTLRQAERSLLTIPEDQRGAIADDGALAVEKREAAETLWPRGNMAEALRLAREARDLWEKATAAFAEGSGPSWVPKANEILAEAATKTAGASKPALERDVRPEDERTFRTLIAALLAVEAEADKSFAGPDAIARTRMARWGASIILAAAILGLAAWSLHRPMFTHATGSAQLGTASPDNTIDGNVHTAWELPGSSGWLELTLGRARPIKDVRIVSGNPPYGDRAAKEIELDAMRNGATVKTTDFTIPQPPAGDSPNWLTIPLGAPTSDELRIVVKSNYRTSAAIAEVKID